MNANSPRIRVGMVGLGMIFDETYRPFFETAHRDGLFRRDFGLVEVDLMGVATRTGSRTEKYRTLAPTGMRNFRNFTGENSAHDLVLSDVGVICVATPDDRHFGPARLALEHKKHLLVEKPSVLTLAELDELQSLAKANGVLAKVVYHKLADPDHKKLRTLYHDDVLRHVNNGYCSLLEPKSIGAGQFAEWVTGRNPGTYVAVHYLKLIDFTFGTGMRLSRVTANGQRGIVGAATGPTWDSVQLQVTYEYPDHREATFDIHTSWVTPDNFPGYVDQEVQFRFDNAVWIAHQRKRGVELTIEGRTPNEFKNTPNFHYNGTFVEPWGERSQRGYGVEVIRRFFEEVAYVEHGGPTGERSARLQQMRQLTYNDIQSDRNCVAIVQAMEAILSAHASGHPGGVVVVNGIDGGLAMYLPGKAEPIRMYEGTV